MINETMDTNETCFVGAQVYLLNKLYQKVDGFASRAYRFPVTLRKPKTIFSTPVKSNMLFHDHADVQQPHYKGMCIVETTHIGLFLT